MEALIAESTGHGFRPVLERGKNNSGGLTSVTHVADLAVLALSIVCLDSFSIGSMALQLLNQENVYKRKEATLS